ncbi:MAG: 30S ribosomal protein S11, partial [Candidatus Nealsonbacteria bacterium]|nr:30S ribosomal protein S11 [Candidatus Nealsonbacteria bacterium]
MGKKKIIVQNQEELIKEREKVDAKLQKEVKIEPRQKITEGQVYIFSSYNNTIINIADPRGNVLSWASAGAI